MLMFIMNNLKELINQKQNLRFYLNLQVFWKKVQEVSEVNRFMIDSFYTSPRALTLAAIKMDLLQLLGFSCRQVSVLSKETMNKQYLKGSKYLPKLLLVLS